MTRREWYERVNAAWPAVVPPLTADEAVRALRRLYRFSHRATLRSRIVVTSGRRHTQRRRLVWYVNPERGWTDLMHVLSHYAERSGHNGTHARMELRMIKEVIKRGWLDGKLKPAPRPVAVRDPRAERRARAAAALERWQRKLKYAQHKVAHYVRSVRRYALLDSKVATPTLPAVAST